MARIGVFLPNWVGDVVMATPALGSLWQRFSDRATLVGIMRPYVAEVLAGSRWFHEQVVGERRGLAGLCALAARLRRLRLDTVLLFTNSFSTALLARLSGAGRRVGFSRDGRGWLLTDRLNAPRVGRDYLPRSAVTHYLDVVGVLGCDTGFRPLELATTVEDEAEADALWALFGWRAGDPVVVLNTGAAYGAAKTWPDEHFTALARWLATTQQLRVLLICGPAERRAVAEICRQADHPSVKSLADHGLRIGLSKACVRRGSLMVTTDSGPRHFAAAFDVPCITLFGPTDPAWSDNTNRRAIDLSLDLPCAPCARRTCPLGHHRCMRDLTVEKVAAAVTQLMERLETSTDLPGRWYAAGRR